MRGDSCIRRFSLILLLAIRASAADTPRATPTFYSDVLPILENRCQVCHRPGEIGPMPLLTFEKVRPWAKAIRQAVKTRQMPPWFAVGGTGHFSNDPSLTTEEIDVISRWAENGTPSGRRVKRETRRWKTTWNIETPTQVVAMPAPVSIPATGDVDYTYEIVPTGLTKDTWVRMAEIRPSAREHVHHAVVYVRPPQSKWLRHAPVGTPFTAADLINEQDRRDAMWTDSDVLLVYAPGSSPDHWPVDMAKLIPAGSDLVFQMHYVTKGVAATDQTSIGLVASEVMPEHRVLTLQLTNDRFLIPPGVDNYRVEVHGTLPNDALLLSFFPHMHLRGKQFEYNVIAPGGKPETLLKVNYDFFWQLSYRLARPLKLQAGTTLQAVAWFDNSKNNRHNPDPESAVRWGEQTSDEMMVGFFDVAVGSDVDKWQFFRRKGER